MTKIIKFAVDARCLTNPPTGIANFSIAALHAISKENPNWIFFLLSHKELHPRSLDRVSTLENVVIVIAPSRILPGNGLFWFLFKFCKLARKNNADWIWGTLGVLPWLSRGLRKLLTVHDLVHRTHSNTMSLRGRIAYTLLADHSISVADLIWCNSKYTCSQLKKFYPEIKSSKLHVASGFDYKKFDAIDFSQNALAATKAKYGVSERSLLFVGTLEPRKNLSFLLRLMPDLQKRNFKLIIVGCKGWGRSDVAEIVNADKFPRDSVVFTDFVSDDDLARLYKTASLFISTSLDEGLGLPQLEAMYLGCPVISPANSGMIEIVEPAGIVVNGWATEKWLASIESGYSTRNELQVAGFSRIKRADVNMDVVDLSGAIKRLD